MGIVDRDGTVYLGADCGAPGSPAAVRRLMQRRCMPRSWWVVLAIGWAFLIGILVGMELMHAH